MPDSRDAVALYQNDPHAPQWVRGMVVDASAQEIKPSHKNLDNAEQQDFRNEVERTVFDALHKAQVAYEDFTPEQMDVIYAVAENGGSLEELLNPEFGPEQMQLIADVQTRTDAIHRSAVDDVLNPLTSKPMTPEEVNQARKEKNLPLDTDTVQNPPAQLKQELSIPHTQTMILAQEEPRQNSKQTSKPSGCCKRWMQNSGRQPQKNRKFFPGMSAGAVFRRHLMRRMRIGQRSMRN